MNPDLITWDRVYLLGYVESDGQLSLTSWEGGDPIVDVVVVGGTPPMWKAPVPEGCRLLPMPTDVSNKREYAQSLGGVHAFGWLIKEGFERRPAMQAQER